jgi:valine dehydrogenase (NAD+)
VLTAFGVFQGMRACAQHVWGEPTLAGRRIAVSGVGKVGHRLVGHLINDGADVLIHDVNPTALARVTSEYPAVKVVAGVDALIREPTDVYSPNALGGALDDDTVRELGATVVCGGANNQLAHEGIEQQLADRGICYAPDYVVNAGGVIQVADELAGFSFERAEARAKQIFNTTVQVLQTADREHIPPAQAADRLAEQRMATAPSDAPPLASA